MARFSSLFAMLLERLRGLVLPTLVLVACLGAIVVLRKAAGARSGPESMQAELNRQFGVFQAALEQYNSSLLELQRRTLEAEQLRRTLTEQFDRSQKELVATQRALDAANRELVSTQEALRRSQEDYQQLQRAPHSPETAPAPTPELPRDDGAFAERLLELEKLRQDNLKIAEAVSRGAEYFDRLWADFVEADHALALLRKRGAVGLPTPEMAPMPVVAPRRPDFGDPLIVAGKEQDAVPNVSPALLRMWIAERFHARSGEMIALQRRLTTVNRTIEDVSRELTARQRALAENQADAPARPRQP